MALRNRFLAFAYRLILLGVGVYALVLLYTFRIVQPETYRGFYYFDNQTLLLASFVVLAEVIANGIGLGKKTNGIVPGVWSPLFLSSLSFTLFDLFAYAILSSSTTSGFFLGSDIKVMEVLIKGNRLHMTSAKAAVRQTSAASIGDFHPADRALIASWLNDFEEVRVIFIAPEGKLNPLRGDRPFFVDAATHRWLGPRRDDLRNRKKILLKSAFQIALGDLFENPVFEFLDLGIEFDHGNAPFQK